MTWEQRILRTLATHGQTHGMTATQLTNVLCTKRDARYDSATIKTACRRAEAKGLLRGHDGAGPRGGRVYTPAPGTVVHCHECSGELDGRFPDFTMCTICSKPLCQRSSCIRKHADSQHDGRTR